MNENGQKTRNEKRYLISYRNSQGKFYIMVPGTYIFVYILNCISVWMNKKTKIET